MLIFLNENLAVESNSFSENDIRNLDDLLMLHSKLLHYVAASKKTVHLISQNFLGKISNRSQETLKTISTQSDNLSSLISATRLYVEIKNKASIGLTIEKNDESFKWICDLQYAVSWLSQPSKIIGEHIGDVDTFQVASKYFAISKKLDPKMQRFIAEMSGGCGNAPVVLTQRIKDGVAPILCIIDSDKISPDHNGSPSISKCHDIVEQMKGISYFHQMEERELENIIPIPLLIHGTLSLPASKDRDTILDSIAILKSIYEDDESTHIYKYIDLKNGTCKSWVAAKGIEKYYANITIKSKCPCKIDCEGYFSPPLFESVRQKVTEFIENSSEKILRDISVESVSKSWIDLGAIVYSVALSNKIRTM
ncbi:hypothetical protein ACO0LL_27960 [Undibacterium sp. TC4M20W]|uniref:hypothetical protein n=1 Tax=Undibacterium sp. TC4M20W TaxID=3413052 RepID=UPI003BEF7A3F